MDKTEMIKLIEDTYSTAVQSFVTRVICKDDIAHYGYFNSFEDYSELKEKNQYRFIPRNNFHAYKDEYVKRGRHNVSHSIILTGEDVVDIQFVLPLHI